MKFNEIEYTPEFRKDLKRLCKRFRTLNGDLDNFITAGLIPFHKLGIDTGGIVRVPGLGVENLSVYKVRKFACRSLKGSGSKSGIRVVYVCFKEKDKLVFIEIYFKGDKENEDRPRILKFLSG